MGKVLNEKDYTYVGVRYESDGAYHVFEKKIYNPNHAKEIVEVEWTRFQKLNGDVVFYDPILN